MLGDQSTQKYMRLDWYIKYYISLDIIYLFVIINLSSELMKEKGMEGIVPWLFLFDYIHRKDKWKGQSADKKYEVVAISININCIILL